MKILANGTLQNNIWKVDFLSQFSICFLFMFLGGIYTPPQDKQSVAAKTVWL